MQVIKTQPKRQVATASLLLESFRRVSCSNTGLVTVSSTPDSLKVHGNSWSNKAVRKIHEIAQQQGTTVASIKVIDNEQGVKVKARFHKAIANFETNLNQLVVDALANSEKINNIGTIKIFDFETQGTHKMGSAYMRFSFDGDIDSIRVILRKEIKAVLGAMGLKATAFKSVARLRSIVDKGGMYQLSFNYAE